MTRRRELQTWSLPIGLVWAPRLARIEGDALIAGDAGDRIKRRASQALLDQFCRISQSPKTSAAVLAFVKRWGMLRLCQHGLPIWHDPNSGCKPCETIEGYKRFSICLDAMLRIGLELGARRCGDSLDWELVDAHLCGPDFPPRSALDRKTLTRSLVMARTEFQILMRRLVDICRVQPRFCWRDDAWAIDFDCSYGSNLAAILTVQLMARIGGPAMRKCRNCPRWFQPKGRQVYCYECGIKAAWKDASARRRRKAVQLRDPRASVKAR